MCKQRIQGFISIYSHCFDNVEQNVCVTLCSSELVFLGAIQHGIILLANEKSASEGSGLCGACSTFLPKVLPGWRESH